MVLLSNTNSQKNTHTEVKYSRIPFKLLQIIRDTQQLVLSFSTPNLGYFYIFHFSVLESYW